ncbi:MAG: 50S ribosomal protein L35 [Chloroflexota bacterium]|nr:50S ribosomal protein L35 [Chloroflexota bacterium]
MPKLKTHQATAKRFKLTGSGKMVRRKRGKRTRSKSVQRQARNKMVEVENAAEVKRVERLVPYIQKYKG